MNILYSCIVDSYDQLKEVNLPAGWRAICFSNTLIESKTWEIIQIAKQDKIFRDIKIRPHVWLPDHDKSVWIDGNLEIKIPLDQFVKDKDGFWLMTHPDRNCIYEEAKKCIELGKDKIEVIEKQATRYRLIGYPEKWGLSATGCLIRDNNDDNRMFGDCWWGEVRDYSVRDQLSFDYVYWRIAAVQVRHFPFLENIQYHYHVHRMKVKKEMIKKNRARITKEYYRRYT